MERAVPVLPLHDGISGRVDSESAIGACLSLGLVESQDLRLG